MNHAEFANRVAEVTANLIKVVRHKWRKRKAKQLADEQRAARYFLRRTPDLPIDDLRWADLSTHTSRGFPSISRAELVRRKSNGLASLTDSDLELQRDIARRQIEIQPLLEDGVSLSNEQIRATARCDLSDELIEEVRRDVRSRQKRRDDEAKDKIAEFLKENLAMSGEEIRQRLGVKVSDKAIDQARWYAQINVVKELLRESGELLNEEIGARLCWDVPDKVIARAKWRVKL